jgi:hypothetical protein
MRGRRKRRQSRIMSGSESYKSGRMGKKSFKMQRRRVGERVGRPQRRLAERVRYLEVSPRE